MDAQGAALIERRHRVAPQSLEGAPLDSLAREVQLESLEERLKTQNAAEPPELRDYLSYLPGWGLPHCREIAQENHGYVAMQLVAAMLRAPGDIGSIVARLHRAVGDGAPDDIFEASPQLLAILAEREEIAVAVAAQPSPSASKGPARL